LLLDQPALLLVTFGEPLLFAVAALWTVGAGVPSGATKMVLLSASSHNPKNGLCVV
jgi:hypothetical protein